MRSLFNDYQLALDKCVVSMVENKSGKQYVFLEWLDSSQLTNLRCIQVVNVAADFSGLKSDMVQVNELFSASGIFAESNGRWKKLSYELSKTSQQVLSTFKTEVAKFDSQISSIYKAEQKAAATKSEEKETFISFDEDDTVGSSGFFKPLSLVSQDSKKISAPSKQDVINKTGWAEKILIAAVLSNSSGEKKADAISFAQGGTYFEYDSFCKSDLGIAKPQSSCTLM